MPSKEGRHLSTKQPDSKAQDKFVLEQLLRLGTGGVQEQSSRPVDPLLQIVQGIEKVLSHGPSMSQDKCVFHLTQLKDLLEGSEEGLPVDSLSTSMQKAMCALTSCLRLSCDALVKSGAEPTSRPQKELFRLCCDLLPLMFDAFGSDASAYLDAADAAGRALCAFESSLQELLTNTLDVLTDDTSCEGRVLNVLRLMLTSWAAHDQGCIHGAVPISRSSPLINSELLRATLSCLARHEDAMELYQSIIAMWSCICGKRPDLLTMNSGGANGHQRSLASVFLRAGVVAALVDALKRFPFQLTVQRPAVDLLLALTGTDKGRNVARAAGAQQALQQLMEAWATDEQMTLTLTMLLDSISDTKQPATSQEDVPKRARVTTQDALCSKAAYGASSVPCSPRRSRVKSLSHGSGKNGAVLSAPTSPRRRTTFEAAAADSHNVEPKHASPRASPRRLANSSRHVAVPLGIGAVAAHAAYRAAVHPLAYVPEPPRNSRALPALFSRASTHAPSADSWAGAHAHQHRPAQHLPHLSSRRSLDHDK
mmetsp:Transcript_18088/g.39003  ORF Transcript_18088/g.39003 Transcript_18088/m.39003 type:complete len:537 (+) Transcript_18088:528-2138(+)